MDEGQMLDCALSAEDVHVLWGRSALARYASAMRAKTLEGVSNAWRS